MSAVLRVAVIAGGPSAEAEVSRTSARAVAGALGRRGHRARILELSAELATQLRTEPYDVAFPAVHGAVGEDGCLQGLLEVLGLPYVGSGVLASALAMHKAFAKVQLRAAGLPVAPDLCVRRGENLDEVAGRIYAQLGARVVVKPVAGGSAIGVTPAEKTRP